MSDLVKRLRGVTESDAYALPWTFGQTCKEAADLIEDLELELRECRMQAVSDDAQYKMLAEQLAAEKALTDRLWRIVKGKSNADEALDACDAYRKARGL